LRTQRPRARWVVALAMVALTVGCRRATTTSEDESASAPAAPSASTESRAPAVRIVHPSAPHSFVDLAAEARPSVVHLRSPQRLSGGSGDGLGATDPHAIGSGVVIDRDGHVLTADHLIARVRDIDVVLPGGDAYRAQVVGRDSRLGVALLKIEPRVALAPAPLGDSDALAVGEWVLALGDPLGDGLTAAAGIISARGRGTSLAEGGLDARALLRIDADVSAESAGGALVNTAGEVVGIVLPSGARPRRGGYAVPITRAVDILPMLREHGAVVRAWLGVFVHPVSEERAARRGLDAPGGALVSEVVPQSPAAKAGLRPGDIVLRFDGEEVDHRSLPHLAAIAGIGTAVALDVRRGTDDLQLTLVTESIPD
jgi:serine protease Do